MQVSVSSGEKPEIAGEISEKFEEKLKVTGPDRDNVVKNREEEENEEDFSFACANPNGSPIAADAIFQNGQIRPIFPLFDQSLICDNVNVERREATVRSPLRKLFVEEKTKQEEPAGPYCEWSSGKTVKQVSPEACKKSNSTGFSKLWRFRELVLRSNSDGKDAFVFLNNNSESIGHREKSSMHGKTMTTTTEEKPSKNEKTTAAEKTSEGVEKVKMTGEKKVKAETVSSAYARHYVKNREMRGDKRKTYSPYRQELLGFFTNVNGMSRNVHPF